MGITSEIAPWSLLRRDLWNVSYDGPLRYDKAEESRLGGYVGGMVAFVARSTVEQAKITVGVLMGRVSEWITVHDFSLAMGKNGISWLKKRPRAIVEKILESRPTSKYPGDWRSTGQIKTAMEKATATRGYIVRPCTSTNIGSFVGDASLPYCLLADCDGDRRSDPRRPPSLEMQNHLRVIDSYS